MAKAGTLPQICYVWCPAGYDEHPPATSNPDYVTDGHDLVWQRVQAVIDGGGWADTTFILTWDDWGGYTDSRPDPGHRDRRRRAAPGRVPGHRRLAHPADHVRRQSRAKASTTAGTPTPASRRRSSTCSACRAIGVAAVDTAASAGRPRRPHADPAATPASGTVITQPAPPTPTPAPVDPRPVARTDRTADARPDHPRRQHPGPRRRGRARHPTEAPAPAPPSRATAAATLAGDLSELVDKTFAGKNATELAAAPLTALKGISPTKAVALTQALGANTIGELAANKYLLAAQTITHAQT